MTERDPQEKRLDTLLDGWGQPVLKEDFKRSLLANLHPEKVGETSRLAGLARVLGPSAALAAAAVLLLVVLALTYRPPVAITKGDVVELKETKGYSYEAMSELYRLIHLEGLADTEELSPEDADTALLLFATGG